VLLQQAPLPVLGLKGGTAFYLQVAPATGKAEASTPAEDSKPAAAAAEAPGADAAAQPSAAAAKDEPQAAAAGAAADAGAATGAAVAMLSEAEKAKLRKERFGQGGPIAGLGMVDPKEEIERRKKRAERFGLPIPVIAAEVRLGMRL
jgi:SAP domain-containing ribonucleoprotein